jgi:hypothetical protein
VVHIAVEPSNERTGAVATEAEAQEAAIAAAAAASEPVDVAAVAQIVARDNEAAKKADDEGSDLKRCTTPDQPIWQRPPPVIPRKGYVPRVLHAQLNAQLNAAPIELVGLINAQPNGQQPNGQPQHRVNRELFPPLDGEQVDPELPSLLNEAALPGLLKEPTKDH